MQSDSSSNDVETPAALSLGDRAIAGLAMLCFTPILLAGPGTILVFILFLNEVPPSGWGDVLGFIAALSPMTAVFSPLSTVPGLVLAGVAVRRIGRAHALGKTLVWMAVAAVALSLIVVLLVLLVAVVK